MAGPGPPASRAGTCSRACADLLLVDTADDALRGLPASHLLDGLVFAAPARPFSGVMVAGRWCALHDAQRGAAFEAAMQALHAPRTG